MKVTVGIKAFNEASHIEAVLRSALEAVRLVGGEVVLADSGSTDATTAIAEQFPVHIVQLDGSERRSCGAGAQLAFQHARGQFFYMLDGDMTLNPSFLPAALEFMERHSDVAAVGGLVKEVHVDNEEFLIREGDVRSGKNSHLQPGFVDRLDGGGLYRVAAIREIGYFADANLHAFEEFDLAARLHNRGWKLARIDHLAVRHHGHRIGGYRLLWRRLRTGYAGGAGEVLRAALGKPYLALVLRRLGHIRHGGAVMLWWMLLFGAACAPFGAAHRVGAIAALLLLPVLFLAWRRGGVGLGLYSFVFWNVTALGLLGGLLRKRHTPGQLLKARQWPDPEVRQPRAGAVG